MLLRNIAFSILLLIPLQCGAASNIATVWGEESLDDPLIEKVIDHKIMQRLKNVDQSGPNPYFNLAPHFSRYEHSLGVWALVRKAGGSRNEQLAALLHDTSHTAFSHVADVLLDNEGEADYYHEGEDSYQDKIHLWFLSQYDMEKFLSDYGIKLDELSPDKEEYKALEEPLPHLCADRMQYNIHTGVALGIITKDTAREIVEDLSFNQNRGWFFNNIATAKKFAKLPLFHSTHLWNSPWNDTLYHYFSVALKRALDKNIISKQDLQFSGDEEILRKLRSSSDDVILNALDKCSRIYDTYSVVAYGEGDLNIRHKFRGIDPLVKHNGSYLPLTELDNDFKREFEETKTQIKQGFGLKLEKITNSQ